MAELKLSEHEALNGGTFVPGNFLGANPAAWDSLYAPARDAQTNGNWETQAADFIDSLMRRGWNAFGGYVYKDSTDTDLQYSVTDFYCEAGGFAWQYAGAINLGPLTAGVANYVYGTLALSGTTPTVTVTSATSGWPAWPTPHIKLDVITPPGSGPWKEQHRARWARSQALALQRMGPAAVCKEFGYNTSSPMTIGPIPDKARPIRVGIHIETVFNGTTPTLTVGDGGSANRLMTTGQNDPKTLGIYLSNPNYKYTANTNLTLTITPSGSTAGAGFVRVEYL